MLRGRQVLQGLTLRQADDYLCALSRTHEPRPQGPMSSNIWVQGTGYVM
jgi:hypothetical protein